MYIFNTLLLVAIAILVLLLVASYGYNLAKEQHKKRLDYVLHILGKNPLPIVYIDKEPIEVWYACIDAVAKAYEELSEF